MKNSEKFMIVVGTAAVALVGFLGYRVVSGGKKIKVKGEEKNDDRIPVELGKTESVDNTESDLNPVLVTGRKEVREALKLAVYNMLRSERGNTEVLDMRDFLRELTYKVSSVYMFNLEVVRAIPKHEEELVRMLKKIKMLRRVRNLLIYNKRQAGIYVEEIVRSKSRKPVPQTIDVSEYNAFSSIYKYNRKSQGEVQVKQG